MQSHLYKTHVGHLAVVAHQCAANLLHGIATPETELGLRIALAQGPHEMGGMQVARSLTGYQIIFHTRKIFDTNISKGERRDK